MPIFTASPQFGAIIYTLIVIVKVAIPILTIVFLVKGIKYLNSKNKRH